MEGFFGNLGKEHPSIISSLFNSFFRLVIYYFVCNAYGFILGTSAFFAFFWIWRAIIKFIFGIEYLSSLDKFFINVDNRDSLNLGSIYRLKNFNSMIVKTAIIDKLCKRIPKISASIRVFLTEYCWNTTQIAKLSLEDRAQIYLKRIKEISMNESDLEPFLEREANKPLDVFDTPIEVFLITLIDSDNEGILYTKADHCFSDGLGFISLMGFLDDDFSIEKYPSILRREMPFLKYLIGNAIDFILGLLIGFIEAGYTATTIKSLYFVKPILSKKGKISNVGKLSLTALKKISKRMNLTINEICIGAIFSALKELDPSKDKISIFIPMGFTTLSKTIDDVQLTNSASGFMGVVRLIDDIVKDKEILKKDIRGLVTKLYKTRGFQLTASFFFGLLNTRIVKALMKPADLDCVITNVPGQEKEIKIGGCSVTESYGVIIPSIYKCFVNIRSYNGNLTVGIGMDDNQELTAKALSERISEKLQKLIEDNKNL